MLKQLKASNVSCNERALVEERVFPVDADFQSLETAKNPFDFFLGLQNVAAFAPNNVFALIFAVFIVE